MGENLAVGRDWVAEHLHHFSDIVGQRHGTGVGRLTAPREFRLYVRRDELEDLDGRFPELNAQRLQPGV